MTLHNFIPRVLVFIMLLLLTTGVLLSQEYILVGWNDLGMHCSNKYFSKIAVLPPYNTVTAQLILKLPNQPPQVVTSGFKIEYSIPNNTYSVGKTDFWTYAQQLFGLPEPLPANVGLTGKGMTGTLDSAGTFFIAPGIPITPFTDLDLVNESPFQLIHLVAKSLLTDSILATTDAVIPVSNEVGCVQAGCHVSETSILNEHEDVPDFNRTGPVLCASCHSSNALGTTGIEEAKSFSFVMHDTHKEDAGPPNSIETCYKCHPGPNTQCLRDIMGKNPTNPMICQDCHGTLDTLALSIEAGRRPWLDEPRCGNCHGETYAEQPGKLYRHSTGHGGLFCSACHGSPHAIQPTVQPNDNAQNIRLQGVAGTLRKCSVCHSTPMTEPGPHGIFDTTAHIAATPNLIFPSNGIVGVTTDPLLQWSIAQYAETYYVQVATDSLFTLLIAADSTITQVSFQLTALDSLQKYYWRVKAKNSFGASDWSNVWAFTTGSGETYSCHVGRNWNIVSLPIAVDNPSVSCLFPHAISNAFAFNPGAGYGIETDLENGKGYWLKFDSPYMVNITGSGIACDTFTVSEGWNLIGSISFDIDASTITSEPPGMVTSNFFGYAGGYFITDSIKSGKGYWVKSTTAGELILSATVHSSANRIRIAPTDEMPPSPPQEQQSYSKPAIPGEFVLEQNYPNPFNPTTVIRYGLPSSEFVSLKIYDMTGRELLELVNRYQSAGYKEATFDASNLPSGIYIYSITAGKYKDSKKMLLVR